MRTGGTADTGIKRLSRPRLVSIVSNAVPVVGVFVLGWSTAAFLAVYLLDLVAVLVWTAVKIPFAEKRPADAIDDRFPLLAPLQAIRGSVSLPGPLPGVYPRNVPTLVGVAFLGCLELGIGVVLFAITRPEITASVVVSALLGGTAVFVVRGGETVADYFAGGGYREHSPRSLALVPLRQFFGLGVLFVPILVLEATVGGVALLDDAVIVLVALGKLGYDLRTVQVRTDPERRGLFARLYGSKRTELEPTSVDVPEREPVTTVRPSRRVAAAESLLRGVAYGFLWRGVVVVPIVVLGVLGSWVELVWAGLGFGLLLAGLRAGGRYLRYGTLRYRCYHGSVIAHDALLDEPRARLDRSDVSEASVAAGWIDRNAGTETLCLDADGVQRPGGLLVPDPDEIDPDAIQDASMELHHLPDARAVTDPLGVSWRLDRDSDRSGED